MTTGGVGEAGEGEKLLQILHQKISKVAHISQ